MKPKVCGLNLHTDGQSLKSVKIMYSTHGMVSDCFWCDPSHLISSHLTPVCLSLPTCKWVPDPLLGLPWGRLNGRRRETGSAFCMLAIDTANEFLPHLHSLGYVILNLLFSLTFRLSGAMKEFSNFRQAPLYLISYHSIF